MTRLVISYILFITLFLSDNCEGGITLSQSIDRTEMKFEETARFEIAINWDGSPGEYRFDKPLRLDAEKLKVTNYSSSISSIGLDENEKTTKLFKYTLVPISAGQGELPSITIEFLNLVDSIAGSLSTDPLEIMIAQPLPKSNNSSSNGYSQPMIISFIVLLLLLSGMGIYWFFHRKDDLKVLSNRDWFLDELTKIKKTSGADLKSFQTELYKSLIWFLNEEYNLEMNGKTLKDILEIIEASELRRDIKDSFTTWLTRAEKEKFSPLASSPGETIRLESEIRQFFKKL